MLLVLSSLLPGFMALSYSQELVLHHSCLPGETGAVRKSAPLAGEETPGPGPPSRGADQGLNPGQ